MARLAFGGFELDPSSGELWKGGDCIRIQEQPLRLLLCLLERPGQVVGRDELQKRVWGGTVHVGFEDSLNAAAWRLRQILGDSAEKPRFIETVPRRGYRFVAKVLPLPGHPPPDSGSFPLPVHRPDSGNLARPAFRPAAPVRSRRIWLEGGLALAALGGAAGLWTAVRAHPVAVEILPLENTTGDPAVDYFASALAQEVGRDLHETRGLEVVLLDAPEAAAPPRPERRLRLAWRLDREALGYRIPVRLQAPGGAVATEIFKADRRELHEIHRRIAAFVAARADAEPAPSH
jgi:DNA-binding winged helix-turn-helix (wHTH) protein